MKKLAVMVIVSLLLTGLVLPALAQEEGPDLSPEPGKFKVVFRNCLRVGVKADLKGLDFWEGEIPGWVDVPQCPSRTALVRATPTGGDRYRGTMSTTFNGESYSLHYEFDSFSGGVELVSFLNEHVVEVKVVDTSQLSPATATPIPTATPTSAIIAEPASQVVGGSPTQAAVQAAPAATAQPTAQPASVAQAAPVAPAQPTAQPASAAQPAAQPSGSTAKVVAESAGKPGERSGITVEVPPYTYYDPKTFGKVPPYVSPNDGVPALPGSTPVYGDRPQQTPLRVLPVTGLTLAPTRSPWVVALFGLLLAFVVRRMFRLKG